MAWTKITKETDTAETMYWGAAGWGSAPWGAIGSLWAKLIKPTDIWIKLDKEVEA